MITRMTSIPICHTYPPPIPMLVRGWDLAEVTPPSLPEPNGPTPLPPDIPEPPKPQDAAPPMENPIPVREPPATLPPQS